MEATTLGAGSPATSTVRWTRVLLLGLLAWWTLRLGTSSATWCLLDFANLAFHEAGHLLLSFAGSTLHYLGGTLAQLAVPLLLGARLLVRDRRPLGAAFCVWWLGESLINVSIFMADARELALPLVGGGDHDWNELFFRFGLLAQPSVDRVSTLTHAVGVTIMLAGLAWVAALAAPLRLRESWAARIRGLVRRVGE